VNKVIQLFGEQRKEVKQEVESLDADAFRCDIIRPALRITNLWSPAAENLLLGTALAESGLRVVKQFARGGALSFYQVEISTFVDCLRYLNKPQKRELKENILSACFLDVFPEASALCWNLRLATLIARVKFYMQKEALPRANDAAGLCKYYLRYYNTHLGKAAFEKSIVHFDAACRMH
jgi:hypothetical protein